jgi:hypothetical protein
MDDLQENVTTDAMSREYLAIEIGLSILEPFGYTAAWVC